MKTTYAKIVTIEFILLVVVLLSFASLERILGLGPDHKNYLIIFVDQQQSVEPFWEFIRKNISLNDQSVLVLYAAVAFISLSIKMTVLTKAGLQWISIPLYIFTFYFLHDYIQIRLSLGLALTFLLLWRVQTKSSMSIILYAAPTLLHYSLAPLSFIPFFRHRLLLFLALVPVGVVIYKGVQTDLVYQFIMLKAGDNSSFLVFNILSTYLFFLHIHFFLFLRRYQMEAWAEFYRASLVFLLMAIPFGIFQFGTSFFRFQELSATLFLPAIFSVLSRLNRNKWIYVLIYSVYYILFSVKLYQDIL